MNDICGNNRIAPRWGFRLRCGLFHRALPCAIEFWAFSPTNSVSSDLKRLKAQGNALWNEIRTSYRKQNTHIIPMPQRGEINMEKLNK